MTLRGINVTSRVIQQSNVQQVNKTLKKHVAIIQSSNKLSLLQRKIGNALLYYAYQFPFEHEVYEISIAEICRLINYKGLDYEKIKRALRALNTTEIEWNILEEYSVEEWGACTMLAGVTLRGGKCRYSYYYDFKKLIFVPDMYGKINLSIQAKFTSTYGLALYENCIRYRGLPSTKWFTIKSYRLLMGVEDGKYSQFRDLKRRVLDKSVEEINSLTDIQVEPDIQYVSRKPHKIRFKLKQRSIKEPEVKRKASPIIACLEEEFGLSPKKVKSLLEQYEIDYLQDKISLVRNLPMHKLDQIKSIAGFYIKAVEEDYQEELSIGELQSKKRKKYLKEAETTLEEKRHFEELRMDYSKYKLAFVTEKLAQLKSEERNKLILNFNETIKKSENLLMLRWCENDKITLPLLSDFIKYANACCPHLLSELATIDNYKTIKK